MNFFSRDTSGNRLNRPLPLDPETGLYSRSFFLVRLKEERERSKRIGNPFSLIIVDVDGMSKALNGKAKRSTSRIHQKKLVEGLVRQSRKIDIKGWLDLKRVGILMPETKKIGALEFKVKICRQIRQDRPGAEKLSLKEFIQVSTFGDGSPDGNGSSLNQYNGEGDWSSLEDEDNAVYTDILSRNLSSLFMRSVKRIFDIVGSLFGIILASPLMLIIAVLIKLNSPGPVLFRQERFGFLGRRFTFLKFRSMVTNADQTIHESYVTDLINGQHGKINRGTTGRPLYKMNDDPRITPIGYILRKTSLDELPQLFNILKGEMSLVGPRPPIPYEVEKYKLWHWGRFFEVKPGLTGLWQVSGRSKTSFDDMVRLDLRYGDNWSLWLDIKIIFKTFHAVLSTEGAY